VAEVKDAVAMNRRLDIGALKVELDHLRPLTPKSVESIERWLDVELTYTSNAIEGSTLTRAETAVLLEKGITVSGKPLKDHLDAVGHKEALDYVRLLAQKDETIREGDIRAIHKLVLGRSDPSAAGSYSTHQRMIAGSLVRFPSPAEIPALMGDFAAWLSKVRPSYGDAIEAHYKLVTIHPFSDCNGRTARLLMNLLLVRVGFPPMIISPEERVQYLTSLEDRQLGRGDRAYKAFMEGQLLKSLKLYVEHLRQERPELERGPRR
jgi:Fic family protein